MKCSLFLVALILALAGCQSTPQAIVPEHMTFVHPGALINAHDLDFVRSKLAAHQEPWQSEFDEVARLAQPLDLTEAPLADEEQKIEALKTYANALCWAYTGEVRYADQAVSHLNLWATYQGYFAPEGQALLQGGWIGALLGPAAELMRAYPGWQPSDQAAMKAMFVDAFYPVLNTRSGWNGNVDLTQVDAMLNIAVFCEDSDEFRLGVQRLRDRLVDYIWISTDPARTDLAFWFQPKRWVDGIMQETLRDNGHHAQYGLASALHAVEVAWNQGIDLYREQKARLVPALELLAKQLNTGSMQDLGDNDVTTTDLYDTFEVGYNGYHGRLGIDLPETSKLLKQRVRLSAVSDWNIFHESLTHQIDPVQK